jgi:hypothetical protein
MDGVDVGQGAVLDVVPARLAALLNALHRGPFADA